MLAAATTVKLIAEIALLALIGQWAVGCMAGAGRQHNPVYRVFELVARPWVRSARWLMPRRVPDRHVPLVASLALVLVWLLAVVVKIGLCLQIGVALCR